MCGNLKPTKNYQKVTPETIKYNQIVCGNCINIMEQIPVKSVDMIITSPPYNVDMKYDTYDDTLSLEEYLKFLGIVWKQSFRILKPGGRIAVNIANIGRNPFIPLSSLVTQQLLDCNFWLRGYVYWDKGMSGTSTAWGSWKSASNPILRDSIEMIIVASKGPANIQHEGISTITRNEFLEYVKSTWHFQAEHSSKFDHPAPFPEELPRRLIKLYTYVNDVVLDPFCGSGTTPFIAKMEKRRYIGIDVSEKYCKMARSRCQQDVLM